MIETEDVMAERFQEILDRHPCKFLTVVFGTWVSLATMLGWVEHEEKTSEVVPETSVGEVRETVSDHLESVQRMAVDTLDETHH